MPPSDTRLWWLWFTLIKITGIFMKHNLNQYDFHDSLIHGIVFYSEPGKFYSDIALDIDYIYE